MNNISKSNRYELRTRAKDQPNVIALIYSLIQTPLMIFKRCVDLLSCLW